MAESSASTNINVGAMAGRDFHNYGEQNINIGCTLPDARGSRLIPPKLYKVLASTSNFFGRKGELSKLEDFVKNCPQSPEDCYENMIVISGFGGMGKSEIAKVFAKKVKDRFNYIFWLNAQSKDSLNSSFQDLIWTLNIKLEKDKETPERMAQEAYARLEANYTKGIFIFDNAESLKSEPNSSFGLEQYLLPDYECKKPVFIVTTRNDWSIHQSEHKFEIIDLCELSNEEARVCFLKYLRIEGLEIPPSLSDTIDKLVKIVEGHPLGISLMGSEAAIQEHKISFKKVEARIKNYLELLQEQPLEKLTRQEKYEWNLQKIFDERMQKVEATESGEDVGLILSILSLLAPEEIYVGLVDGIFCRKIFYPQKYFCVSFSVGDSELRVKRALKLLQSNSLIRIESVTIYPGNFDMIRIHGLVQRCAGKSQSDLLQPAHALQLISDFFAKNVVNDHFRGHISSILKIQEETKIISENLVVLSLIFEFTLTPVIKEVRDEVVRLLSSRGWNAEENLVSLMKIRVNPKSKGKRDLRVIKELLLGLPEDLIRRGWIFQLCTRILLEYISYFDGPDRRKLQSWLKKCSVECPSINRYFIYVLDCFYKKNNSGVGAEDGEFVLKVFSIASERQRWWFWYGMHSLRNGVFMGLVPFLFPSSGEKSLIVKSLEFPVNEHRIDFLKYWAWNFEPCVSKVIGNEEMREKLLATEEFVRALKDITEFGFNEITREFDVSLARGILHLLFIWLELFSAHEDTYERFGEFVDRIVIYLPENTRYALFKHWTGDWKWKELKDLSFKLRSLEYCSVATKSWNRALTAT